MGYSGISSHVSLWFPCRGNPLPARRIKQMIKCLACLVLKHVSSGFVSFSVNDCFPLSMVSSVCEVQMQLGYEQERMVITSPKENSTGWLEGHWECMAGLQCLRENVFYLKGVKEGEENMQRKKQCWRVRQWLIILPVTTAVDFITVKTTQYSLIA